MLVKLRSMCVVACILCIPASAMAAPVEASGTARLELRVAMVSDGRADYFVRLLEASLKLIGQPYSIQYVKDIPARRMWWMLGQGEINLFYGMQSKEKDHSKQLVTVRNGLTNGLIGQRVLMIRRADTQVFAQVRSVEDLKRSGLIAGFGAGWRDTEVAKAAGLPLYEHAAPWNTIYAMVAAGNRHVDYLPRGIIEVQEEARAHPELVVEQHLLLEYQADFVFYLDASVARYRPILERALNEAETSGLKARLLNQAFGADIKALKLNRRLRLQLPAPKD
ncbi:hypothetical protein [Duganella sp. BuS-21]|uniref:hypothetical protein n=1 Tax=Duganella sp. BuS-21 TaxID=2943848 RepID=UPI0035A638E1